MGSIDELGGDLRIASQILEWEIGDIWGHVGVRVPEDQSIAVKLCRVPDEGEKDDLIVNFDYSLIADFGDNRLYETRNSLARSEFVLDPSSRRSR